VPDHCVIELDRRLLPGEKPADAVADVEAFLKGYPGIDFPFTPTTPKLACTPLAPIGSDGLVATLGSAIDAVVGKHAVTVVPYGTDASTIAAAGVPAVVFGPGDIAQAHTKDEWVDLRQVEQAAEVLYRFACAVGR
jgi:acetylornithine deacetylase/succinyl-diaminopimelate desuccinylase-like protein